MNTCGTCKYFTANGANNIYVPTTFHYCGRIEHIAAIDGDT
jgi:hypothetical protein